MNRIDFVYYIELEFPGMGREEIVKEVSRLKQSEKDICMTRPREYDNEMSNKVSAQLNAAQREMYTRLGRARWLRCVLDAEILSNPNSVLNMTEKD